MEEWCSMWLIFELGSLAIYNMYGDIQGVHWLLGRYLGIIITCWSGNKLLCNNRLYHSMFNTIFVKYIFHSVVCVCFFIEIILFIIITDAITFFTHVTMHSTISSYNYLAVVCGVSSPHTAVAYWQTDAEVHLRIIIGFVIITMINIHGRWIATFNIALEINIIIRRHWLRMSSRYRLSIVEQI